jgi:hypothetical protein
MLQDFISPVDNLNVILYLSTCHNVYISVLILFMIIPLLIINTYVSLMYELKKKGKVFTSKFVGTGRGPRLIKKKLPGRGLTKVKKHWSMVWPAPELDILIYVCDIGLCYDNTQSTISQNTIYI